MTPSSLRSARPLSVDIRSETTYYKLIDMPLSHSSSPLFAQVPEMLSHCSSTLLSAHNERPGGLPGALVNSKPPAIVRLRRVWLLVKKNVPVVLIVGAEFVTHPSLEQPENVDCILTVSDPSKVPPRREVRPPVRVDDTKDDPPSGQLVR